MHLHAQAADVPWSFPHHSRVDVLGESRRLGRRGSLTIHCVLFLLLAFVLQLHSSHGHAFVALVEVPADDPLVEELEGVRLRVEDVEFAHATAEEKVEALEASAEVSAEMGSLGGNALPGSAESSIESQFKALEASSSVDDELAKLKGLIGESSSAPKNSGDGKVDDELEKLKRDAGL